MSDVTRYTAAGNGVVRTDTDGALVSHDDYAWLHYENARLKAEVERLTKAGDAMRDKLCWCYMDGYPSTKEAKDKWNAAKEVQS